MANFLPLVSPAPIFHPRFHEKWQQRYLLATLHFASENKTVNIDLPAYKADQRRLITLFVLLSSKYPDVVR